MTLRPGDVLGRYQVLCPIGAGGMAEVYAARVAGAESFEKLVALKVMLPHLSGDPKFVRMFVDEARVAARIESAHVVSTLDLGKDAREGLYQVLELVLGGSLRQLLDATEAPLPTRIALTVLTEVARGLADAHAARGVDGAPLGLVHRDVSPHNVLVGVDGRARLSDFGVARAAASVSATESGELKGKLAYAAPEQLRGETAVAASDVFALGVVIWEVLAGRRLFVAENPLALVDMMMTRPIPRLDEVRPELGAELADLCARALERDRGARTITAAELAKGLEVIASVHGGLASREEVGELVRERAGAPLDELETTIRRRAAELAAAPAEVATATSVPTRSSASLGLGLAIVALLLLLLGVTVWRGPGADATSDAGGPLEAQTESPADPQARAVPEPAEPTGETEIAGVEDGAGPENGSEHAGGVSEVEGPAPETAPEHAGAPGGERSAATARTARATDREARAAASIDPDAGPLRVTPVEEPIDEPEAPQQPEGDGLLGIEDFDRSGSH